MVLIVAYWAMVSVMDPDKYQVDSVLFSLIIAHIYYFEGAGMCNVSNSIRRPCVLDLSFCVEYFGFVSLGL